MSKYSQVRSYLKQQIEACDPSLSEWKRSLSHTDIPTNQINNRYHISFPSVATTTPNNLYRDTVTATVRIFKKEHDNFSVSIDEMLDKAYDIRNAILDIEEMHSTDNIRFCTVVGIELEDYAASNKNIIEVRLSVTATLLFPF